jgi:GntR family transcriptional regulator
MRSNSDILYLRIKEDIKSKIKSGEYKLHERVPSEMEICEKYGVSRISAKKALDELARDGYIVRMIGKGSFVTYKHIYHLLAGLYSITDEVRKRGMTPGSKLLAFRELAVSEVEGSEAVELQQKLFLQSFDRVYFIRRLRYADDEIVALDNTYIPVKYCPAISQEELERTGSLYNIMETRVHCGPTRAQEYFFARATTAEEPPFWRFFPRSRPEGHAHRLCQRQRLNTITASIGGKNTTTNDLQRHD